jgi:hypothetical protein
MQCGRTQAAAVGGELRSRISRLDAHKIIPLGWKAPGRFPLRDASTSAKLPLDRLRFASYSGSQSKVARM